MKNFNLSDYSQCGRGCYEELLIDAFIKKDVKSQTNTNLTKRFVRFENWDSIEFMGKSYPSSLEGIMQIAKAKYGVKSSINHTFTGNEKLSAQYVRIYGEFDIALTLMPTIKINGNTYAIKDYKESSKTVGDYISLTGGSKSYGNTPNENAIALPYYEENFNAGNGRVTAGREGNFYVPIGKKIEVFLCSLEYA